MSGMEFALSIGLISLLGFIGAVQVCVDYRRSAANVLLDLAANEEDPGALRGVRDGRAKLVLDDAFGKAGLLSDDEKRLFQKRQRVIPIFSTLVALLVVVIAGGAKTANLVAIGLVAWGAGYLFIRGSLNREKERYRKDLEFYLPLVMERLVMAVQSGLDIMAAIGVIVALQPKGEKPDPVTRLLGVVHKLTESGLTFEQALNQVAAITECSAVRHAFIHLAVAHKEGGELVMPLKELSDSTQAYFQESVEEEIAKLPVKATMPLLLTFTGLIICFVTTPIIQILSLMQKQMEVFQ